eukprot:snap_masked-scaffold_7-processed-gene-16.29-mRNA-1 protein AED:1.00 eAED:1.00 QI:0/-1/0/0/-1/1/1/0/151
MDRSSRGIVLSRNVKDITRSEKLRNRIKYRDITNKSVKRQEQILDKPNSKVAHQVKEAFKNIRYEDIDENPKHWIRRSKKLQNKASKQLTKTKHFRLATQLQKSRIPYEEIFLESNIKTNIVPRSYNFKKYYANKSSWYEAYEKEYKNFSP